MRVPTEPGFVNGGMLRRESPNEGPILVIDVDDIDAALQKIESLGGQTLIGRQAVGDMGWAAYFKDVEGNSMGLWQSALTPTEHRLPPMLPPSDRRACIIGAGSSGITAAQVLDARGIPFDCFEMGSAVGGNWRYDNDNGVSSAYLLAAHQHLPARHGVRRVPDAGDAARLPEPLADRRLLRRLRRPLRAARPDHASAPRW